MSCFFPKWFKKLKQQKKVKEMYEKKCSILLEADLKSRSLSFCQGLLKVMVLVDAALMWTLDSSMPFNDEEE